MMIKQETAEKVREMLKELGWSEEVINQYLAESFGDTDEAHG